MKHFFLKTWLWFVSPVALLASVLSAEAADIAGDVQNGLNLNENGGYLELGLAAGYFHQPYRVNSGGVESDEVFTSIDASGAFRKNGFFFEAVQAAHDGLNLGYTLFQNGRWSLDLLGANLIGFYEPDRDERIRSGDDEETRNRKLLNRSTLYMGAGLRLTHYVDKYVLQYRLVTDTLGNNGVASSLRVGRGWQVRNWNFFGIASANYASEKTNNFLYQVEPHEATRKYPAYDSASSISYSLQFGVVKPLSEKWLIRFYGGWVQFSDEARDSPLTDNSDAGYVAVAVNRVFSWGR